MINIPNHLKPALSRNSLESLNSKVYQPLNKETVENLNKNRFGNSQESPATEGITPKNGAAGQNHMSKQSSVYAENDSYRQYPVQDPARQTADRVPDIIIPAMQHLLRKGQKTSVDPQNKGLKRIKACFGWNVLNAQCDMDASAFLISDTGKVPDDSWFVFYGQNNSPDNSVKFSNDTSGKNREIISIDLRKLDDHIRKIVFVLTINEAFEKKLNFSMIRDAYVRLMDESTNQEILSFQLEEYYDSVTSMTIGELYLHNGQWKFNPVGNGVYQDLAGQCAIYGVEIDGGEG